MYPTVSFKGYISLERLRPMSRDGIKQTGRSLCRDFMDCRRRKGRKIG